jgi:pimeloyl-ACP methyl ester carboxylesterase
MGAWCWKRVLPRLRAANHEVFTPTLSGLGELSHLITPEIDLNTHVKDIVNFLEYQDLNNVVLLAHSYAGMPAGCAIHRVPERIKQLVYVDAYVPENGKSFFDLQASRFREMIQELAKAEGEGWKIPALDPDGESLGVSDSSDIEWLRSKLTAHPLRTLENSAILGNPDADKIPRAYIYCTGNPPDGTFPRISNQIKQDERWNYSELDSPHAAMITAPDALAARILQAME